MSPRKKANESEQAAELEGGTPTTNAATAASSRAGSFDILELNDLERGITPEDSEDVKWNYLSGALHTRKILTGVVSGIEPQENGNIFCAIDFEGIRVLIPGNEMFMDSWPEGTSPPIRYQIRLNRILGATIDFMLAGVDFVNRAAVGSRRAALLQRQARYYATERVKVGSRVACRVIGVGNNRITVDTYRMQSATSSTALLIFFAASTGTWFIAADFSAVPYTINHSGHEVCHFIRGMSII